MILGNAQVRLGIANHRKTLLGSNLMVTIFHANVLTNSAVNGCSLYALTLWRASIASSIAICINTLKSEGKITHKWRIIANFAKCFEKY